MALRTDEKLLFYMSWMLRASLKRGQWEIAVCRKLTEVDWIKEATTAAWRLQKGILLSTCVYT